jgi:hypothetical protein
MYLSRRTDDREIILKRQQKDLLPDLRRRPRSPPRGRRPRPAPRLRLVLPLLPRPRPLPRPRRHPEEHFLQAVGAATDPASGGRQMPSHWSSRELHIVTQSSLHRDPVPPRRRLRRSRPLLPQPSRSRRAEGSAGRLSRVQGRQISTATKSSTSPSATAPPRGRVLGVAQHRLQSQAARPLRRRRQRLRHLRPRRSQHPRRQHLAAARQLPQLPFR